MLLTLIFIGLAFVIAVAFDDKVRGLGLAIVAWLGFAVVYDGIVMLPASVFSEYPLERTLIVLVTLNPIDLARVLLLLRFDIAALMGYTGAVLDEFFGSSVGMLFAFAALALWVVVPVVLAMWLFRRKDF